MFNLQSVFLPKEDMGRCTAGIAAQPSRPSQPAQTQKAHAELQQPAHPPNHPPTHQLPCTGNRLPTCLGLIRRHSPSSITRARRMRLDCAGRGTGDVSKTCKMLLLVGSNQALKQQVPLLLSITCWADAAKAV